MSTGNAASATTTSTVPATTTGVGHCAELVVSVHHGTPNSSASTIINVMLKNTGRSDRRAGFACTASPTDMIARSS